MYVCMYIHKHTHALPHLEQLAESLLRALVGDCDTQRSPPADPRRFLCSQAYVHAMAVILGTAWVLSRCWMSGMVECIVAMAEECR